MPSIRFGAPQDPGGEPPDDTDASGPSARIQINPPTEDAEVDLNRVFDLVAPRIVNAARTSNELLKKAGVRHILVGGMAVGAYGHPRTTKDVDYLVGEEAFIKHEGGVVTMHPEVPLMVGDVPIDYLSIGPGEEHLAEAFASAPSSEGIAVAPVEVVVYLKLKSPRPDDHRDVSQLILVGIDAQRVRDYLLKHAPKRLIARFDQLVAQAARS
ncbi:MAG: hypothetical protein HYX75_15215 [Acidobacteria bacterium]|nr:hypothetical protein [Acidobacteriota bacterium]